MHHEIDPTCHTSTVLYDATACHIAARVGLRLDAVETSHRLRHPVPSVIDAPSDVFAQRDGEAQDPGWGWGGLDRDAFADIFDHTSAVDEHVLEFAHQLMRRLHALSGAACPALGVGVRRRNAPRDVSMDVSSGSSSSAGMRDSSGSNSSLDAIACGFSEKDAHVDIDILCEGLAIRKTGGGLYRTARALSRITNGAYFEVVVVEDCRAGGICIGVATEKLALNKLVGSDGASIGLHSSGLVVSGNGEFRQFGKAFKNGDRVGCLVRRGTHTMCEGAVELEYWINGEWQGSVTEGLGEDVEVGKRTLYAAVSLYRKGSKAVMQCCKKDWAMWAEVSDRRDAHAICGRGWSSENSWQ